MTSLDFRTIKASVSYTHLDVYKRQVQNVYSSLEITDEALAAMEAA